MGISVYVAGSGIGYGYFVNGIGESFYVQKPEIINNQAEYVEIIFVLKKYVYADEEVTI